MKNENESENDFFLSREEKRLYSYLNYRRNEQKRIYMSLNYQRNEDKPKYLFLNYRRKEDKAKYSFLNYRWFDIATRVRLPLKANNKNIIV